MAIKSVDALSKKKKFLWKCIRIFFTEHFKFFFEGNINLRGQLWYHERKLLYYSILKYKPQNCFEIGTWMGGGTTFFIASALLKNKSGFLNTIEVNKEFYNETVNNYKKYLPDLLPYINFSLGDYKENFSKILKNIKGIDFLILDGAEDAQQTLEQYNFFKKYFHKGSIIIVHDWFTEKSELIREILLNKNEYHVEKILQPPKSLGMCLVIKK